MNYIQSVLEVQGRFGDANVEVPKVAHPPGSRDFKNLFWKTLQSSG
jgi:hypothetical protein